MAAPRTGAVIAGLLGRRLRSLAAVELLPDYLALNARIVFLPRVVYGSLTMDLAVPTGIPCFFRVSLSKLIHCL